MNSGFARQIILCRFWLGIALASMAVSVAAQQIPSGPLRVDDGEAAVFHPATGANPAPVHRFWDRENVLLFAGVAAFRNLDYASTLNMQSRGREEILLPDDVVNNRAGFMALESAATATSIGLSYLLHCTGHHKLERWLSIGHIGAAGFGAARNYALQTKRP